MHIIELKIIYVVTGRSYFSLGKNRVTIRLRNYFIFSIFILPPMFYIEIKLLNVKIFITLLLKSKIEIPIQPDQKVL